MRVSAYYNDGGALRSVLTWTGDEDGGAVTVVNSDSYALASAAEVAVNGNPAENSDIRKYDVLTDNGSGVYTVTRSKITARLEDAEPSLNAADTVTVLGKTLDVLDCAAGALAGFKIGDTVTLLLTAGGRVAGAVSETECRVVNYGVVTSLSGAGAVVRLANGISVSGAVGTVGAGVYTGSLVSVSSSNAGTLNLYVPGTEAPRVLLISSTVLLAAPSSPKL
jgi:hypothetical protein